MAFANTRIDQDLIIYSTVGGPRFSTTVAQSQAGFEKRNANWAFPLGKWEIGEREATQDELHTLARFFHARKGKWQAFRFRDWADYTVGPGEGVLLPIDGQPGQFQLYKSYDGTLRKITKPITSSVRLYGNAGPLEYAMDDLTGVVTCAQPPVRWTGEFDVPVRFDTDDFKARFMHLDKQRGVSIFYVFSLPVCEVME